MTGRFIAITAPGSDLTDIVHRTSELASHQAMRVVHRQEALIVYSDGDHDVHSLPDIGACMIGDAFCRNVPAKAFNGEIDNALLVTAAYRSGELHRKYWGSYVLLNAVSDGTVDCERSPFSNINVYFTVEQGHLVMASDADLLLRITNRARSVDWDAITRHLIWDNLSFTQTCLSGITELRCGEALHFDSRGNIATKIVWNPWEFTHGEAQIHEPEAATELIRREIYRCVSARLPSGGIYCIDLSGGLDSSIIAAAAAKSGRDISGINIFSSGSDGDERVFARSIADHLGISLEEGEPDPGRPDLRQAARPHLPRPHSRSFVQETDRISSELAARRSASTFVNGQGGDAVFCHLQSSAPAADSLTFGRSIPSFARTAFEVARANQVIVWDIAWKSIKKALKGKRHTDWHADKTYLSNEAQGLTLGTDLPWPIPTETALPGKVEQVHGLYNSCYNMNGYQRADTMKGEFPLLSQPLVEACLRVPTWHWIGGGRNRLIARLAMERDLPKNIVWRTSKGGLGQLQIQMMRQHRTLIREMLMDGLLSNAGVLNCQSIERRLKDEAALEGNDTGRILRLCDVEAWCGAC